MEEAAKVVILLARAKKTSRITTLSTFVTLRATPEHSHLESDFARLLILPRVMNNQDSSSSSGQDRARRPALRHWKRLECQKVTKVLFYAVLRHFVTFGPLLSLLRDSGLILVVFGPELHIYS